MKTMKSKEGVFLFLSTLFLISSFAFNVVFFNIAKFKVDTKVNPDNHSLNYRVHFDFLDELKAPKTLVKGKCIYMVVDAMRYDFVFETDLNNARMPFLTRLLREEKAAPFKLNAWPPTVTLPRIKSLVSGIIPEFIDILWNFHTTYLVEDNFLRQFKIKQKSINFFGDDTWLKLFDSKQYFKRYDGVSSFVASDYYEVDTNVTRHLKDELKKSDWDLMILHYLGLDHVGHIEGPFAPVNIKRKLFEMDEIVHKIYSSLNEDDLFIIVSDHGMANEGGHGGSSRMETLTPLVMISNSKFSDDKKLDDFELKKLFANIPTFEQVDLVSTLSCLYDLPIPEHNRGIMFINEFVKNLNRFDKKSKEVQTTTFKCLQQNLKQLDKLLNLKEDEEFVNGVNSLTREFRNKLAEGTADDLIGLNNQYSSLLKQRMDKEKSSNGINQKQTFYMILILTFMIMLYLTIASVHFNSSTRIVFVQALTSKIRLILSMAGTVCILVSINVSVLRSDELFTTNNAILAMAIFGVCFNVNLFLNKRSLKEYVRALRMNSSPAEYFYMFSAVLYLLSLFSSSFIEEEHQIWYYLETTQLYLIVFWSADKWGRSKDLLKPFLLIAVTRVLRSINQTGNKWIHLKDMSDFLRESESKFLLVVVASISIATIYTFQNLIRINKSGGKNWFNPKIWILSYVLVYVYQMTACNELFDLYERNLIAKACYLTLFFSLVYNLIKTVRYDFKQSRTPRVNRSFYILHILTNIWLLFNCLIQPTTNLLVLVLWQIKEYLLMTTFLSFNSSLNSTGTKSYTKSVFFYIIINQMCYFSQGNSNSLNTIQVSTGLVGLNETNMFISGFLMFSATYSSNIYWFLISMKHLFYEKMTNEESLLDIKKVISDTISFKTFATTTVCSLYTMSAFMQREHLFVWSVFAPKLIYQLSFLLLEYILLIGLKFIHTNIPSTTLTDM